MTPELEDLVRRIRDGEAEDSEAADTIEVLADAIEVLGAALDEARAEKDAAITVIESLRDMLRDARDALDAANAENESFYQAGFDTGVKLQHALTKGPKVVSMQAVSVGATATGECRRCGKPIWAGQWRFGSDEAGWEHMEGECPS